MSRRMTAAELKATRAYLGYQLRELAEYLDTPLSAARDWERERYLPPPEVTERVRELVALTDEAVSYLTRHYETHTAEWPIELPKSEADCEWVYPDVRRPVGASLGWWRMVIARVAHNLPDAGVDWT